LSLNRAPAHVVLLGDSTLDNLIWVNRSVADSVVGRLRAGLREHFAPAAPLVTNCAADGFTSGDVLRGAVPAVSGGARAAAGEPFPGWEANEIFRPLEALDALQKESAPCSHAVVSVGGNDFLEALSRQRPLAETAAEFSANLAAIIARMENTAAPPRIVLMLQYRPCLATDAEGHGVYRAIDRAIPGEAPPLAKLNQLMESVYRPILAAARARRIAVVDLPRAMDPADPDLFVNQIEPSAKSSALIAAILVHLLASHDFAGPSRLYRTDAAGGFQSELNDASAPWTIRRA